MKIRSIINRNMRNAENTEYRKEQMRAYEVLKTIYKPYQVRLEYYTFLKPVETMKATKARLDIAILLDNLKIAIRLQGRVHFTSKNRRDKDNDQKTALEANGWIVIDFIDELMPELWKGINKEEYTKEILQQLKKLNLTN